MDTMDGPVKRAPVQRPMKPVVVSVLDNEEEGDLPSHERRSWERDCVLNTAKFHHRVEEKNHWHFNDKMDCEDILDAVPLVVS